MSDRERRFSSGLSGKSNAFDAQDDGPAPGRSTLTEDLRPPVGGHVQRSGGHDDVSGQAAAAGFSGSTIDIPHRAEMEQGFGRSFSDVKAYAGGPASHANDALGSEAYAVGNQVAFKSASPAKEVVAHELAHTVQQSGGAGAPQTWTVGSPGDAYEHEADAAADAVLSGQTPQINMRTGGSIQR